MAAPKKPKKAVVQFLISLGVAVLFGLITIAVIYLLVTGFVNHSQKEKKKLNEELSTVQDELEKVKHQSKLIAPIKVSEVQTVRAIHAGEPIVASLVTLVETPEKKAYTDSFRKLSDVVGKMAAVEINMGETLTRNKVTEINAFAQMAVGSRAMTIMVEKVGTLGGQLEAGSYVDILLTLEAEEGQAFTRTLLQRVSVLSLGEGGGRGALAKSAQQNSQQQGQMVTLAVSPKEAELLVLAQNKGKFHMTLRGYDDNAIQTLAGVDIGQLLLGKKASSSGLVKPLPPLPQEVQQFIGSQNWQNPASFANGNLPTPGTPNAGSSQGKGFSMEVFKGANSENVQFNK